jgi:hypothetical protein
LKTSEKIPMAEMFFSRIQRHLPQIHPYQLRRESEVQGLTVMASAAVGVAGDEVSARWLADVKNRMNTARRRSNSGDVPVRFRHGGEGARGGAWQRGEKGVNGG